MYIPTGAEKQKNGCDIVNIFLSIKKTFVLSAQKNCLIEINMCLRCSKELSH